MSESLPQQAQSLRIPLENAAEGQALLGPGDKYLQLIHRLTDASIRFRDDEIVLQGPKEELDWLEHLFDVLLRLVRGGYELSERDVSYAAELARQFEADRLLDVLSGLLTTTFRGKPVRIRTIGQQRYVSEIRDKTIVFGIGPAGTGKTYLAVVSAVLALKKGEVRRIVLTRPAVEAGESLGFLPGDLREKINPYLRPLYDALHDVLGAEQVGRLLERGVIEIAPLAYMRGRTLEDAFVILDEAQNTTPEQMKMFLTRLGFGSKMVITGDVTQIDLPRGKQSGLVEAERVLRGIEEIGIVHLTERDVVRHSVVQKIIEAYEREDRRKRPAALESGE